MISSKHFENISDRHILVQMSTRFQIIQTFEEFSKIREQWNELVQKCDSYHAFMRHEWFTCRMNHLDDTSLCFVVGFRGNDLISAAPMRFTHEKMKGLPVKVLTFAASTITPRSGFIANSDTDMADLIQFIYKLSGFDILLLSGLDEQIQSTEWIKTFLNNKDRYEHLIEPARQSPYLICENNWENYYNNTLSKSFRTLLQRGSNKLKRAGSVETDNITDFSTLHHLIPDLVDVSSKSWKAKENTDLSALPQVVSFLLEFSKMTESSELWELWTLKLDGKIIAFDYYLKCNTSISLIRTDFDLAYRSVSPGNNLQLTILKDLFEREGIWEYDMGGQAYDYKLKWTETVRSHISIYIGAQGLYGKMLLRGKKSLLPRLKRLVGSEAKE